MFNEPFTNNFMKSSIGFDDFFRAFEDFTKAPTKVLTYPFYNIKKVDDNRYVLEMALAGFAKQDLDIVLENGVLTITGTVKEDDNADYIFKGIADRAFTRKFTLSDTVEIKNAEMLNGILKIWLDRMIPPEKLPKKIEISEPEEDKKKK